MSKYEYNYYDGKNTCSHGYIIPQIMKILPSPIMGNGHKVRILDMGAGNGRFCKYLLENGYEIIGIEQSPSGVEFAKKNNPKGSFFCASIYDKPLGQFRAYFDFVVSLEVIEHLIKPRELLRASKYYLKKGGGLLLTTPYHGYLKNLAMSLSNKWGSHFSPLWDGGHVKFFSVKTLSELCNAEGMAVEEIKFAGRFPFFWKSMICHAKRIK